MTTSLLLELSIGEGASIALLPTEDPAEILAELDTFWDELTSRPGMADEATDEEIAAWLDEEADGDPNYWRWVAEYGAAAVDGAPADFAAAVADVFAYGVTYVQPGIDWAAIIDEPWG